MSIFARKSSTNTDVSIPVYEGYHTEFNGELLAVQEGYEDLLGVIESIHALDMEDLEMRKDVKILQESGADALEIDARMEKFNSVTEGMAGNVWERIKAFFTNMLGKLRAFFNSVIRAFDNMFKSGKDFATKHEQDLRGLTLGGFKYKMFEYTNIDGSDKANTFLTTASSAIVVLNYTSGEKIESQIEKFDETKDEIFNKLRGTYCGVNDLDKDEYTEALYRHFRNGAKDETDKEEKPINIGDIINTLKSETAAKKAKDAEADCEKIFKDEISKIDKMGREHQTNAGKKDIADTTRTAHYNMVAVAQKRSSAFSEAKTIALQYFGAWKSAVLARNNDYKAVCMAAFRYKKEA